jgi:ammonia channel protein AmtB
MPFTGQCSKVSSQRVFAGTAATIVSGAVAERIEFHRASSSRVTVGIIYPTAGRRL